MKRNPPQPPVPGVIFENAVYTLGAVQKQFGWGYKGSKLAQAKGLETISLGRQKFVTGKSVLSFFEQLATQQAGDNSEEVFRGL